MDARASSPPGDVRPARALALIRIVVGFWFLKTLGTKVGFVWLAGVVPVPAASDRWIRFMAVRVAEWAESNPLGWQQSFLREVVIPNAELFAHLTFYGEVLVGIGLTFGLLTGWAAVGGLYLMLSYVLASAGVPFNQQGLHVVLIACLAAFIAAPAGRTWGLDGWRARRRQRSAKAMARSTSAETVIGPMPPGTGAKAAS